jgi:hypothetical protein
LSTTISDHEDARPPNYRRLPDTPRDRKQCWTCAHSRLFERRVACLRYRCFVLHERICADFKVDRDYLGVITHESDPTDEELSYLRSLEIRDID